jgi:hypothetical protein
LVEPPLVAAAESVQHAKDADEQCREGHGVLQSRAHIHDACLQGGKTCTGPQVPPDFRRILNESRTDQDIDMPLELREALELFRQSGTWQCIKDRKPVALETGIPAFPERRRTGQREHRAGEQLVVSDPAFSLSISDVYDGIEL